MVKLHHDSEKSAHTMIAPFQPGVSPVANNLPSDFAETFLESGCLYATPSGDLLVGYGACEKSVRRDFGKLSVFTPDFQLRDGFPWRIYSDWARLPAAELATLLGESAIDGAPLQWEAPDWSSFVGDYTDVKHLIQEGKLEKAAPVAAQRLKVGFSSNVLRAMVLRTLRRQPDGQVVYGHWEKGAGIFGTTPERLFELHPFKRGTPTLTSLALAGTRSPTSTQSLMDDPKEIHEHQVVIRGISEQLASLGSVHFTPPVEVRFPSLFHLSSTITVATNRDIDFTEAVLALHPTPAIGAWPQAEGKKWLSQSRSSLIRGRHGAPFAVLQPHSEGAECLVAIRNVQWQGATAAIIAGCGIVAESDLKREEAELDIKMRSVRIALGL